MLSGEKVFLRPIVKDDLSFLNSWKNTEKIYKYLGGGFMPVSIDTQVNWMENMIDTTGSNKRFMICEKKSETPVGMVGLYSIDKIHRTTEIGLYIGDESKQGKGFANESAMIIERFAKNYLNLRKITLKVVDDNNYGTKLWESLKYQKVGKLTEERYINGEYKDVIIMEKFL